MSDQTSISYLDAGVDIAAGEALVERIKPIAKRTRRSGVLGGLGGFGALFELDLHQYEHPILVSGTDGVGTKLKLAGQLNRHDTIGIDLAAMCANDLVVQGAEPLFFLDYYATGKLDVDTAAQVVEGIGRGCEFAGMALVGGETAEMPGVYQDEDYDLAGFCVGVVDKCALIDGTRVKPGDALIGLASSGPHSNGYSLIRKLIEVGNADLAADFHGKTLGEVLLEPTRIYVKPVLKLMQHVRIHAIAHITGGGLSDNLPRVMPEGCAAQVDLSCWQRPPIFDWLQEQGHITGAEMLRTFNCGIGMVLCVSAEDREQALTELDSSGEKAFPIGEVVSAGKSATRYKNLA